jgi:hypothetical protein
MLTKLENWLKENQLDNDKWIWKRDAAEILNVSEKTLERRVESGQIGQLNKGQKVFYKVSDLLKYEKGILKIVANASGKVAAKVKETALEETLTFTLDEVANLFTLFAKHLKEQAKIIEKRKSSKSK